MVHNGCASYLFLLLCHLRDSAEVRTGCICQSLQVRLFDLATVRRTAGDPEDLNQLPLGSLADYLKATKAPLQDITQVQKGPAGTLTSGNASAGVQMTCPKSPLPRSKVKSVRTARLVKRPSQSKAGPDKILTGLTRDRLGVLLDKHGQYAEKYRLIIWGFLLAVPGNHEAYTQLADRGPCGSLMGQVKSLRACGRPLVQQLGRTLSQLAHWCPLFGETAFLLDLAFPFVKLFGANGEACFEVLVTVLTNWCQGWFEVFPHPPLTLLKKFHLLLAHHDQQLAEHLQTTLGNQDLGMGQHNQFVWRMMTTLMSEVLHKGDWLKVWDHCFSQAPSFFYFVLVAFLLYQRTHLLGLSKYRELEVYISQPKVLDIKQVLLLARQLETGTPEYKQVGLSQLTPIARGPSYPSFNDYPTTSLQLQQAERQRIIEAEDALMRRRRVLGELQMKTQQVAYETSTFVKERQALNQLEFLRKQTLREAEEQILEEIARVDDKAKQERLGQVHHIEAAYLDSLQQMKVDWQKEMQALQAEVEYKKKVLANKLRRKKEENDIKVLEFQCQQRLHTLEQDHLRDQGQARVRDMALARQMELELKQKEKERQWEVEEEACRLQQQHKQAQKAQMAANLSNEQAAHVLLMGMELDVMEKLHKLEAERALRQLAEQQLQLSATQLEAQQQRYAARARAEEDLVRTQAQVHGQWLEAEQTRRKELLRAEEDAVRQQQLQVELEAEEVVVATRSAEAELKLQEHRRHLEEVNLEEERQCQKLLEQLAMERRRDNELEEELRHRHQAIRSVLHASMGPEVRSQSFEHAPPAMDTAVDQHEQENARCLRTMRHAERMEELMKQREAQLLDVAALAKDVHNPRKAGSGSDGGQDCGKRTGEASLAEDLRGASSIRSGDRDNLEGVLVKRAHISTTSRPMTSGTHSSDTVSELRKRLAEVSRILDKGREVQEERKRETLKDEEPMSALSCSCSPSSDARTLDLRQSWLDNLMRDLDISTLKSIRSQDRDHHQDHLQTDPQACSLSRGTSIAADAHGDLSRQVSSPSCTSGMMMSKAPSSLPDLSMEPSVSKPVLYPGFTSMTTSATSRGSTALPSPSYSSMGTTPLHLKHPLLLSTLMENGLPTPSSVVTGSAYSPVLLEVNHRSRKQDRPTRMCTPASSTSASSGPPLQVHGWKLSESDEDSETRTRIPGKENLATPPTGQMCRTQTAASLESLSWSETLRLIGHLPIAHNDSEAGVSSTT